MDLKSVMIALALVAVVSASKKPFQKTKQKRFMSPAEFAMKPGFRNAAPGRVQVEFEIRASLQIRLGS